ncbi:natterin-3-like [Mastacembelus armatus]|uniref:natterin-3-like n=1 Tax=Mastacembelus armatus TaxID=205130 RepID=UPI000E4565F3|nr:natterin-3-like [Mastacembelus armatus]
MALLSLLLLLLLLTLSSVSLQDLQDQNGLEDTVPADRSTRLLPPAKLRQKRQTQPPFDNGNLKWISWSSGSLPNGTVSIQNDYANRVDYVCKYGCHAGFYNPNKGHVCNYPYGDKEYQESRFELLVDEGNFEILEWKDDSYGSVPQHSVRTCFSDELYVGRNKYGLGKVHPKHKAFFLPWEGKEYWYKYYKVLTFKQDIENEHVSDVKYDTGRAVIVTYPPEAMTSTTVINHECYKVVKTAHLSKTSRVEKRWDVGTSVKVSVRKTFTAGIPTVASGSVEVSAEVSVQASGGQTHSEEIGHSLSVEIIVPPNHSCTARMLGHKYKIDIPFTARLTRTYSDGTTTWRSVSGTYSGVQVGEVHTVVERCVPVANAKDCP